VTTQPLAGPAPRCLRALATLTLWSMACAAQSAAPSSKALAACVKISDGAERLACYDKLAGRSAAPSAVPPAAAPVSSPTSSPASAQAASSASTSQIFGLYSAEHPKPPAFSRTLEARVVGLGQSADGRMTVRLEGGGLWELLEERDPLLAVGDKVSVRRAALGSYLMSTPTRRTHRVRRLR